MEDKIKCILGILFIWATIAAGSVIHVGLGIAIAVWVLVGLFTMVFLHVRREKIPDYDTRYIPVSMALGIAVLVVLLIDMRDIRKEREEEIRRKLFE